MIDSHCHLDLAAFSNDWLSVLDDAKAAGITRILIPGTQPDSWQHQQVIASHQPQLLPVDIALGLHPYFLPNNKLHIHQALHQLEEALTTVADKLVALGEIGLDGHISLDMALQQLAFKAQLHMAQEANLPVILHHRKSHHLIFEALKHTQFNGGGVIHGFSGSIEVAKAYMDNGFYIGVGGTITYERAVKTRQTVAYLLAHYPSRLLLETDAPDMPMQGRQGMRNSPSYLADVVMALSDLGHFSVGDIVNQTTKNYYALFHPRQKHTPISCEE